MAEGGAGGPSRLVGGRQRRRGGDRPPPPAFSAAAGCSDQDVFHYNSILSYIPIDCSLTAVSSCWPGLGSLLRRDVNPCRNFVVLHSN